MRKIGSGKLYQADDILLTVIDSRKMIVVNLCFDAVVGESGGVTWVNSGSLSNRELSDLF